MHGLDEIGHGQRRRIGCGVLLDGAYRVAGLEPVRSERVPERVRASRGAPHAWTQEWCAGGRIRGGGTAASRTCPTRRPSPKSSWAGGNRHDKGGGTRAP